jgi:hypothetical protein
MSPVLMGEFQSKHITFYFRIKYFLWHISLQKIYGKYKKELGSTGAGLTEEELNSEDHRNKIGMWHKCSSHGGC